MSINPYETDKLLGEYLLFHYGSAEQVLSWPNGPRDALDYAVRCVSECVDVSCLPVNARALDVGCAVGRSSFELSRYCADVTGIDYSHRFIDAAQRMAAEKEHPYLRIDEGEIATPLIARLPAGVDCDRVHFEQGDAHQLRGDLGRFDVVLAANLIDRLRQPRRFLDQLPDLVKPGGQLVITSPYTWLPEYTARDEWLGGFSGQDGPNRTFDALAGRLGVHFEMSASKDLPFLIREHARKYQWSVAQATIWRRHE